jgi:hypothetical protein
MPELNPKTLNPMRWPAQWNAAHIDLLKGTPVNCVVVASGPISEQLAEAGYKVIAPAKAPEGVTLLEGTWPGIRFSRFGGRDTVSAGPTGEPWVDSNVWPVRLAQARTPGTQVWVRALPRDNNMLPGPFIAAMADAAVAGGQWIITLSESLATGIAERKTEAIQAWKSITGAAAFFAQKRDWSDFQPEAVPGVLSDFKTSKAQDALNLITRSGQQYRIVLREGLRPEGLAGLKAIIDPDATVPPPAVRATVLDFVNSGGILVAGPEWGAITGAVPSGPHPRFDIFKVGQGTAAISRNAMNDPYLLATDAGIIISHRHDLLRFWNGGPLSAVFSSGKDRKRGLVQIAFYSNRPATGDTSLWVAGPWKAARMLTPADPGGRPAQAVQQRDGLEINLPGAAGYIALELEA